MNWETGIDIYTLLIYLWASQVALVVKNAGDMGLVHALGRSAEKEMAAHSSNLACKSPMKEPDGLWPMGLGTMNKIDH